MTAPFFEDLSVGDDLSDVPAVTITDAHNAIHQAIFGDRLRLPIDHESSRQVTGRGTSLANPSLVTNIIIGQSTVASQRVMGNLFYRGLVLESPVFVGDTLSTTTRVAALRQNRKKQGRPASGMVALEICAENQVGETVAKFWRCPMIPCRDPDVVTGHQDDFDFMPAEIGDDRLASVVPAWQPDKMPHKSNVRRAIAVGESRRVEARDTVTLAPELVRLTLNLAMAHTDKGRSVYGKRLVYGGYTISMAAAQLSRVLPNMLTILAWYHCDHVAPVFEEDILQSEVTLERVFESRRGDIGIVRIRTFAERGENSPESGNDVEVLDWRLAVLLG